MEIYKGDAGVRLTTLEIITLIEHDLLDDVIKLIGLLAALEFNPEKIVDYINEDEDTRVKDLLARLFPGTFAP